MTLGLKLATLGVVCLFLAVFWMVARKHGGKGRPLSQMRPSADDVDVLSTERTISSDHKITPGWLEKLRKQEAQDRKRHSAAQARRKAADAKAEKQARVRPWDDKP